MSHDAPIPDRIADTYRVEGLLGQGGMSRVFRVVDERNGRTLALKQASTTSRTSEGSRAFSLFRQEYRVLTQLVHPNVVAVGECSFDAERPFYTMELLEGRTVHELAPLPWRRLCKILLDLCSPLSMLHARRFVHCDVSARNVLITRDDTTKLIDFGALAAIDQPTSTIAGTPPHMAPELVRGQSIDGRVDMFALGALAYWALAGRHAYPVRTIQELPQAWLTEPPTLTELGLELPPALDAIIMSLLSLDLAARPLQLAELVQRLCAVLDTPYAVDASALRAELATPRLVGREDALAMFRNVHHTAATRARGAVLAIAGPKGMGRSRMLEACALDALLAGRLVLRVACQEGVSAPCSLLARIVQAAIYQDVRLTAALPPAVRALLDGARSTELALAAELERTSDAQLQQWWLELGAQRTAVVLVDDFALGDVSSVQRLLALVDAVKRAPIVLVVTTGVGDTKLERDLTAVLQWGQNIRLSELSLQETTHLLRSLFGEAAGLDGLAEWVQRVGAGVPRASVELAHYAIECGAVQYVGGRFLISDAIEQLQLPKALDEAIAQRIASLGAMAREALGALSLITPFGPLAWFEQIELLCMAGWSQAQVLDAFDVLRDARLIAIAADSYRLRSENFRHHASLQLSAQQTRVWHGRLASLYETRGHPVRMVCALHYEYAGERATAYALLLKIDAQLRGFDDPNIVLGGSPLGIALHQTMLTHAIESGAPRVEVVHFGRVMLRIGAVSAPGVAAIGQQALLQLREDTGLDQWEHADPALDEHAKLLWCLGQAHERFLKAPPGERLPIFEAVGHFAQSASAMSAICVSACDSGPLAQLVAWLLPLRTLSPALALSYRLLELTTRALSCGGNETESWLSLLLTLRERPEGWPELIHVYVVGTLHFRVGCELAALGDAAYLTHAEQLAAHRRTKAQASSLHLLHALAHGSMPEAARHRKERAIAAMSSGHEDQLLLYGYYSELKLLEACGDLLELQRLATWIEARAQRYPGWLPLSAAARACYLLLCDQGAKAEPLLAAAVHAAPALQHRGWYFVRSLRAEAALQSGEPGLALAMAEEALQIARDAGMNTRPETRAERVSALAHALLGDTTAALAVIEPCLRELAPEMETTVRAGQLYETRARIALLASDGAAFDSYFPRVKSIYGRTAHPGLSAKLQRLAFAAQRRRLEHDATVASLTWLWRTRERYETVQTELEKLTLRERFDYLLTLLLQDSQADAGHLYTHTTAGHFTRVASRNTLPSDAALDASVDEFASDLLGSEDELTRTLAGIAALGTLTRQHPELDSEQYTAIALRSEKAVLQGIALLRFAADATPRGCAPELCLLVADVLEREPRSDVRA